MFGSNPLSPCCRKSLATDPETPRIRFTRGALESAILLVLQLLPSASRMKLFTPTPSRRLNEATGFVFLAAGILLLLSEASFHAQDPSWDTVAGNSAPTTNLIGPFGAYLADVLLQSFGVACFLFPLLLFALGWKWIRSEAVSAPLIRAFGSALLILSACGAAALLPDWRLFDHTVTLGGALGFLVAGSLRRGLHTSGTAVVLVTVFIVSFYLISSFTLEKLHGWLSPLFAVLARIRENWRRSLERRREAALQKQQARQRYRTRQKEREARSGGAGCPPSRRVRTGCRAPTSPSHHSSTVSNPAPAATRRQRLRRQPVPVSETLPWDDPPALAAAKLSAEIACSPSRPSPASPGEIPICQLADTPPPAGELAEFPFSKTAKREPKVKHTTIYRLPPTTLLNEIPVRSAFDEQELKNVAAAIKAKFEEFNVLGSVVQINPGPCRHHVRVQARSRHQIQPHYQPHRGSLPRSPGRIHPDRAHPGQTHHRHRSPQHPPRSHQPARRHRIG